MVLNVLMTGKKSITLSKEYNMTDHYFVEVIADNGEILRWEALNKKQADWIYNEQVDLNGSENCKTGKTAGINSNPAHRW